MDSLLSQHGLTHVVEFENKDDSILIGKSPVSWSLPWQGGCKSFRRDGRLPKFRVTLRLGGDSHLPDSTRPDTAQKDQRVTPHHSVAEVLGNLPPPPSSRGGGGADRPLTVAEGDLPHAVAEGGGAMATRTVIRTSIVWLASFTMAKGPTVLVAPALAVQPIMLWFGYEKKETSICPMLMTLPRGLLAQGFPTFLFFRLLHYFHHQQADDHKKKLGITTGRLDTPVRSTCRTTTAQPISPASV